jgi:hypothetical protein
VPQPDLKYRWRGVDHIVKPQEIWRYLSFFFDSFLKFNFHMQYYTNKGFSTICTCNMLGKSCSSLGPKQRVVCYNAYIISILTYGMPLWYAENGKGCLKNLRKMAWVQSFTTRWITGAFRGSPTRVLEMISGIPPLRLWCNLMLRGYIAWISSLLHEHLLKKAWSRNNLPDCLCHFEPKRHTCHLPSDNALQCLRGGNPIHEQFDDLHEANCLGCRVADLFPNCFLYLHLDTPKKNSDGFPDWI